MLLTIDVGNTQTHVGLFSAKELIASWRFATEVKKTGDEIATLLEAFLRIDGFPLDSHLGHRGSLGGSPAERRVRDHGQGEARSRGPCDRPRA